MPSATAYIQVDDETFDAIDRELAAIEGIGRHEVGAKGIIKGLKKAGGIVTKRVKERLPLPGYPGDLKEKPPLRESLRTEVKQYRGVFVAVIGYSWYGGQHGHLAEAGHRMVVGGKVARTGRDGKAVIAPDDVLKAMKLKPGGGSVGKVVGVVRGRWDIKEVAKDTAAQQQEAIFEGVLEAIAEAQKHGALR